MGTHESRKDKLRLIVAAFCGIVFCVSGYVVISQRMRAHSENQAFEDLAAQTGQGGATTVFQDGETTPYTGFDVPEDFHQYDVLHERNPDLFGWIRIDGTELNYPVMYTPDDPEHYLRRAFDGTYAVSGVPFLDADCDTGCGNYLIYGHNMNDGTMFATLLDYADETFWREHPVIRFDTVDAPGEYEVLAAFYTRINDADETGEFRYYDYADLTDEETFTEYIRQVRGASLYDTGVTARYGDQLLTLTTCSYHIANENSVFCSEKCSEPKSAQS